ncbi:ABC-F family ATP-binding cassette domain-containing protein [Aeromicrobium sp. CTD01-1L150]|uniref:ABC-F family ATP-binding cassette domain-containing protein n=1 Tax=Aeromicrobium sp. CTD01-1L150 TaxID=3341830 RepID=UPI0035C03BC0
MSDSRPQPDGVRPLIGGEGLHLSFPTRDVLDGVTLGLGKGDRVGIVGRNGDGKSTLMRVLARRQEPDSGRVTWRRDLRVGFLEQRDLLDAGGTVGHAVVGERADHEWAGDPRIRDIVTGLLHDVERDAVIGDLSGGQRRRVALAQVMVGEHDVLFLDEPTNHLDLEGVTWLAEHFSGRATSSGGGAGPGGRAANDTALAVVTHDRWFLDAVCTRTWEVHDGVVDAFDGGYAAYVLQRVERDRQAAASEKRRQNLMRKELAWLRRGAPARTSKPKFRIDAANQLIEREPPVRDAVELQQLATARLGKDVVDLLDVHVSFGEREVLRGVQWRIAPGERAGILGINGAGKSTLLGLVTGEVRPSAGRVKRGKTVKVATLSQSLHELEDVESDRVSDVIGRQRATYVSGGKEMTPGQLLERLGFTSTQLSTPVRDLSGGQRRRLQLLLVLLDEPNVLILDEPTNDLDTDMLAAVEDLLDTWPGTLLVVSHDRYLLERVTDHQYAVMDGRLRHLPGGVDEYLRLRAAAETRPSRGEQSRPKPATKASSAAQDRQARKDVARLERQIERLSEREAELDQQMVEAATDASALAPLARERADVVAEREALEEQWLEVSETLE